MKYSRLLGQRTQLAFSLLIFIFTLSLSCLKDVHAAPPIKCGVNSLSITNRCGLNLYQSASVTCYDGSRDQLQINKQCLAPEIFQQLARNLCNNRCTPRCAAEADFDKDGIGDACDPEINWTLCTIDQVESGVAACAPCAGQYFSPQEVCAVLTDHSSVRLSDSDGDGIPQSNPITGLTMDNCQETNNPNQADQNRNGIGDACE